MFYEKLDPIFRSLKAAVTDRFSRVISVPSVSCLKFLRRDTLYTHDTSLLPSVLAIADCEIGIFSEIFIVTVEPPSGRI